MELERTDIANQEFRGRTERIVSRSERVSDDLVLRDEQLVLEGLEQAVKLGWITEEELEDNIRAYHNGRVAH